MADGFPIPDYQWFKDGELLPGETRSFLYIQETLPEDRGNYTCIAINGGGETQSLPATLDIPGKHCVMYDAITWTIAKTSILKMVCKK